MKYKNEINLMNISRTTDTIGNVIDTITESIPVLYEEHSIGSKEFYNAVSVGMRPVAEVQIKKYDYSWQQKVELNGVILDVLRVITKGRHDVVLVLGHKLNNNGDEITENVGS